METCMKSRSQSTNKRIYIIHIVFILIVMASAYLVRTPSVALSKMDSATKEAYSDNSHQPYFIDMDSYYHVRLVDEYMATGHFGNSTSEEGKAWDTMSYYPKGLKRRGGSGSRSPHIQDMKPEPAGSNCQCFRKSRLSIM